MTFHDMTSMWNYHDDSDLKESELERFDLVDDQEWADGMQMTGLWINQLWYNGRIDHRLPEQPDAYYINFDDGDRGHCRYNQIRYRPGTAGIHDPFTVNGHQVSCSGHTPPTFYLRQVFYRDWIWASNPQASLTIRVDFQSQIMLDRIRMKSPQLPALANTLDVTLNIVNGSQVFTIAQFQHQPIANNFQDFEVKRPASGIEIRLVAVDEAAYRLGPIAFFGCVFEGVENRFPLMYEYDFSRVMTEPELTDSEILLPHENGSQVRVNKEILSLRSSGFREILQDEAKCEIPDMNAEDFESILTATYGMGIDESRALDMYMDAQKLGISRVVTRLEEWFAENMNRDTLLRLTSQENGILDEAPALYEAVVRVIPRLLQEGVINEDDCRAMIPHVAFAVGFYSV